MTNSADPDHLTSSETTDLDLHHNGRAYPGSAGPAWSDFVPTSGLTSELVSIFKAGFSVLEYSATAL